MSPNIMDGDIMLIKPIEEVPNGSIVIVKVNGFEATCKKVKIGKNTLTLIPYNNEHEIKVFTDKDKRDESVTIIGHVLEVRRLRN